MSIEAMKQALEALEANEKLINGEEDCFGLEGAMDGYYSGCFDVDGVNKLTDQAITSLRQAIAEAEKQEPVAWMRTSGTGSPVVTEELLVEMPEMRWNFQTALYTHPQPKREWVGLTDEEVEAYEDWADFQVGCGRQTLFDMIRDIDAKLKEKNT